MQHRIFLALAIFVAGASLPARAETDWSVAAASWRDQLNELNQAAAAQRLCGLPAAAAVEASMRGTIAGLGQALGVGRKAAPAEQRGLVAAAGGRRKFCTDVALMTKAKATLNAVEARLLATGANINLPYQPPQQSALSPTMLTPVIDPDIALIRGCRTAVIKRTGSKRADSNAFWTQYERCIGDQGAGWY